ncbi:MAG: helix-turn-helix domain-containing protein, partial [Flavobacterium sp.]
LKTQRLSPLIRIEKELFSELLLFLENIRKEIRDKNRDENIIRAFVYLILSKLDKAQNMSDTSHLDFNSENQGNRHLQGFIKLVEKNYLEVHEVQFYADRLFISANYLNKIVRDLLGTTSKKYIAQKIMQEAKNLLNFTDLSIAEISNQLNFETPSYFTRFFKKSEGLKPKEFRLANRPSKST